MQPGWQNQLRIARPSTHFPQTERFWTDGIGLDVLGRVDDAPDGEHALVFLGWPQAAWHLELVDSSEMTPSPTAEDLLVLYLEHPVLDETVRRIEAAGGTRAPSHNPYWDVHGITFQDPDGYRTVLSTRTW